MKEQELRGKGGLFRFISFNLGEEKYGQDIMYIHEVNRVQNITEVPGSPEYILGVVNLRGNVIPVMDLRRRLELPPKEMTKQSRIIVVEFNDSQLGLLVDSVHHVMEIASESILDPPEATMTERNKFIHGIGHVDDNLVFFLDIERIYNEETTSNQLLQNETAAVD